MKLFLKWSKWVDLSTGQFEHQQYLLQAKRREDGKLKFRVETSRICWYAKKVELEDLIKVQAPQ